MLNPKRGQFRSRADRGRGQTLVEFAMILPAAEKAEAMNAAERLITVLATRVTSESTLTVSNPLASADATALAA